MKVTLAIIVFLAVAALLIFETVALLNRQPGDTISEIIWAASMRRPLVPFLFGLILGLLSGHFFWQAASH